VTLTRTYVRLHGLTDPPLSIFWRFLRFGALAWGGPAAQIAMIKAECVDELGWVDEETFKKTLAVYQVLPGPEAHELCVYFGRMRGGKLGGLLAGLGFMLPGFVLMLTLSVVYVEASLEGHLGDLFYGLTAAVGAIVARALVRLSRTFITDIPLAVIAIAGFAATVALDATFILVLLGGGLAYELWTNAGRWTRRANALAPWPAAIVFVAGAISVSLTATIFWEGLKAGLVTFGGAFTVIPFLQQSAVDTHHWLTDSQFVDGLAMGGILPAPLIIFSTFVGRLGRRAGDHVGDLPARLRVPDLPAPPVRRRCGERAHPPVPARGRRGGDRADRRGHGRHPGHQHRRRLHGRPRGRRLCGAAALARQADRPVGRPDLRRDRARPSGHRGLNVTRRGSRRAC
jgi:putative chromate ion transporter